MRLGGVFLVQAEAQHHGRTQDGGQRVGHALAGDVGGRSRGWARTGPGCLPFRLAEGSMPMEPVSMEASSHRMSPNMLPVTTTSNALGALTSCMAALSTYMCVQVHVGVLLAALR